MTSPSNPSLSQGSLWRRWDLHVHSPESRLNNQFGSYPGAWDEYVHALFTKAIAKNIAAIGITDYMSVDGYRILQQNYLNNQEKLESVFAREIQCDPDFLTKVRAIKIFPNIEFRLDRYIETRKSSSSKRLTLHVLFSDEVTVEDIEHNFLVQLKFSYQGFTQAKEDRLPLTRANLEKLGATRKAEHDKFQESALITGYSLAAVDDEEISKILSDSHSTFGGKYILVLALEYLEETSWDGAGHNPKKILYQKCDMVFSSNQKTIDWWSSKDRVTEFGKTKPCIWGSDAHSIKDLFEPAENRYCWIKGDVTFRGLKQLETEVRDRCYIGECPPGLLNILTQRKVYISSLEFSKQESEIFQEIWFAGIKLIFNPGMVAIIGNKGAGKSALADSLALLATPNVVQQHYSFLKNGRFRGKDARTKINRADQFEAKLTWSNNDSVTRRLSWEQSEEEPARVHYLPQGYLERLCSEQDEGAQEELQKELDRVIFSHVKVADRLGKRSLAELIDYQAHEIIRSKSNLKKRLRDLNHRIVIIDQKLSKATFDLVTKKIDFYEQSLNQHDSNKPQVVLAPQAQGPIPSHLAAAVMKVEEIDHKITALRQRRSEAETELARLCIQRQRAIQLHERLDKFEKHYNDIILDIKHTSEQLGIAELSIVAASINKGPVEVFLEKLQSSISNLEDLTDSQSLTGIQQQISSLEQEKKEHRKILDAPNQEYQKYRTALLEWEQRREEILGSAETPDTLLYYKTQLEEIIGQLPGERDALLSERRAVAVSIHNEIIKQVNIYKEFYKPIANYISNQQNSDIKEIQERMKISFEVVIDGNNFSKEFFEKIAQNVSGSFSGNPEGQKRLADMMQKGIFDDADSAVGFIDDIMNALEQDLRGANKRSPNHSIEKQLRKGATLESLYNFLYEMTYLELRYALKIGSKGIQELSPGERGLLLLYFYLALDKSNSPLIIDQPEENLDNQSVKDILVPCIREAKERRQLFIVTHNPNIAVVCDAEQIIFTSIDKANNYAITCESGSIEDEIINRHAVNVLEGTRSAFDHRKTKYETGGSI